MRFYWRRGNYKFWCQQLEKLTHTHIEREGTMGCLLHQSLLIMRFSYLLANNFGNFYYILIGWFIKLSVQTLQQLIVIYRRGNFVQNIGDVHQGGSILDIFIFRPKRESANNFYEYNTPMDDLKFILSLKTSDNQTYNAMFRYL